MLMGDTAADITSIASAVATIIVLILQILARNKQIAIHDDVKKSLVDTPVAPKS